MGEAVSVKNSLLNINASVIAIPASPFIWTDDRLDSGSHVLNTPSYAKLNGNDDDSRGLTMTGPLEDARLTMERVFFGLACIAIVVLVVLAIKKTLALASVVPAVFVAAAFCCFIMLRWREREEWLRDRQR